MQDWIQDIRYGFRLLLKRPAFCAAAILALALGIGSSSAMFSLLDRVLLQPLPYPEPERLVSFWETKLVDGLDHEMLSPVNFLDYRGLEDTFEDAAAWWNPEINLTDESGEPVRVRTIEVSANFFQVMGAPPLIGSGFPEEESLFNSDRIAMISHRLWRSRYGGDEAVLGKVLQLNGRPYKVAGVMPPGFNFPRQTDVWQRLSWDLGQHSRFAHFMEGVGRLKEGVTVEQANQALDLLSQQLAGEFSNSNRDRSARVLPLLHEVVGGYRQGLLILFGAVGLLLLLACANVANMLLSRTHSRLREVALRSALGAGRWRLVRQLLTESLILGVVGAALGVALATLGLKWLLSASLIEIPRLGAVTVDFRLLGFGVAAGIATTLLFGVVPALQLARADLRGPLAEAGRTQQSGRSGSRLRSLLVVGEVALSIILLLGSALLVRSFQELLDEDPGFRQTGIVTFNIELPSPRQAADWPQVGQFYTQLKRNLEEHPAIDEVGASGFLPLQTGWRIGVGIKGRAPVPAEEETRAQYITATPGYFKALGIPLLQGRDFNSFDTAQSPGVVIINQELAEREYGVDNPIDEVLISRTNGIGPLGRALLQDFEYRIVGVVGDVKNNTLRSEVEPALYFVHTQFPYKNMNLVINGRGTPAQLAELVNEQVKRLDPNLPRPEAQPIGRILQEARAEPRFVMLVMSGFAVVALVLAAVGLYGVLSYLVSQRTHEIGIRMALGAPPSAVRRQIVAGGFSLVIAGAAAGLLVALALARVVSFANLLYGVEVFDWAALGSALGLIVAVSIVACYAPAHRASRVDPLKALRVEP